MQQNPSADEKEASTSYQMTPPPPPPSPVKDLAIDMDKANDGSSDDGMDTQHNCQKLMNPNDPEESFTNAEKEEIVEWMKCHPPVNAT